MTKRTVLFVGVGAAVLLVGAVLATSAMKSRGTGFSMQKMQPVDAPLAAKAESGCWFKVKNRSSRAAEVKQWESVVSTGAKTEQLGELLIVTGAMEPAVKGERYYGCSLFQYTPGSPVVMTATTAPMPISAERVIPFGFSADGTKQQR